MLRKCEEFGVGIRVRDWWRERERHGGSLSEKLEHHRVRVSRFRKGASDIGTGNARASKQRRPCSDEQSDGFSSSTNEADSFVPALRLRQCIALLERDLQQKQRARARGRNRADSEASHCFTRPPLIK